MANRLVLVVPSALCSKIHPHAKKDLKHNQDGKRENFTVKADDQILARTFLIDSQESQMEPPAGETTAPSLFGTIGKHVDDIDKLDAGEDETQKPIEEIESMCVSCHESVCTFGLSEY